MNKNNLMTHMICGYPNLEKSKDIFFALSEKSKFIEVQIPFSDPIADGPVIEKANHTAINSGITPDICFEFLSEVISKTKTPVLIMTYFNIVNFYGVENFCKKAKKSGVYGLIIPDFPFDHEVFDNLILFSKKYNLHLIQVVSPSTSNERLKKIGEISSGFVYAMSKNMTTGNEIDLKKGLEDYILNLRKFINIPIGVGFGISKKDEIEFVNKISDFAIIGSSVIREYQKGENHKDGLKKIDKIVGEFVS